MKSKFNAARYFYTSYGWYVCMRRGDEKIRSVINFRKIEYKMIDNIPIAGPFINFRQLSRWFDAHIALHGKNREISLFIDDDVIIPETNRIGDPPFI